MKLIYGDPDTAITEDPLTHDFRIFVPGTAGLPKGRTTVLLIANNGYYDSNPAAINVYRTSGAPNRRPVIAWPAAKPVLPGEMFSAMLAGTDPEGFEVRFSQWSGEVGKLDGSAYLWSVPRAQPDGDYKVHFIATDGTAGNSHESKELSIPVRSTIAELAADVTEGGAPLRVRFSSAGSRDKAGGALTYAWNFGDDGASTSENPTHVFASPGDYVVNLSVTGASGTHSGSAAIRVRRRR
jgi:PKD repeat protein